MYLGRTLEVRLKSGRMFVGRLALLDRYMSMCLDCCCKICMETITRSCVSSGCSLCMHGLIQWDVVHVF